MDHESVTAALVECIKAAGGSKVVGAKLQREYVDATREMARIAKRFEALAQQAQTISKP